MKKFFKWVLIVVAILLAVFVIGGLVLPSTWTVSESATIEAPAEKVYEQIADLRNWQVWSPWTKEMDPTQVYTYEGPESGVGAKWLWTSEKMGKGYLLINEADVSKGIVYELFIDMNNSPNTIKGAIAYAPVGHALNVVWTDEGDAGNNLVKRWFGLFIKYMLRKELKTGLAKLKATVEANKEVEAENSEPKVETVVEEANAAEANVEDTEPKAEADKGEADAAGIEAK